MRLQWEPEIIIKSWFIIEVARLTDQRRKVLLKL
jgi:hypothetical protein